MPGPPIEPEKILIVDDEAAAAALAVFLEKQGYRVEREARGDAAADRIAQTQPAAVLLEIDLPGKDGFDACRDVRSCYRGPLVVVTARGSELDHVLALELGADDFLVKPVAPRIVLAHLKAILRRASSARSDARNAGMHRFGRLRLDARARSVFLGERELVLTTAEFDLLGLFASRAGAVLSRNAIMTHLRGIGHDHVDRSIDMRVSRLRKLLGEDSTNPRGIKTVRGRGYLFNPAAWD